MVLAGLGGVIVLLQGVIALIYGEFLYFSFFNNSAGSLPFGIGVTTSGIFEIIVGACMLAATYLMASNYFKAIGAIILVIFSIISVLLGGGWVVGFILGLCGGVLSLIRK